MSHRIAARVTPFLIAILLVSGLAGCIDKRTQQWLYLEPDGALTWSVVESEVRSDENEAPAREREEAEYLAGAIVGRHRVAEALAALQPHDLETTVERSRRPFQVRTVARFHDPAWTLQRYFDLLGIVGDVDLRRAGSTWELVIRVDLEATEQAEDGPADNHESLLELWPENDEIRIVPAQGKFLDAVGFDIVGIAAIPTAVEADPETGLLIWRLVWQGPGTGDHSSH